MIRNFITKHRNTSKKALEPYPALNKYMQAEIRAALKRYGLQLSEECPIEAVVEYILIAADIEPYTAEEWIRETLENYPECFR